MSDTKKYMVIVQYRKLILSEKLQKARGMADVSCLEGGSGKLINRHLYGQKNFRGYEERIITRKWIRPRAKLSNDQMVFPI